MSISKVSALVLVGAGFLAACDVPAGGGLSGSAGGAGGVATGGGSATAGVPVALSRSGQDSCGAVDHKFLEGQPFAHTFDLALPAGTRFLGRRQDASVENANRLSVVVSTRSPSMAPFTADATILRVFCG